MLLTGCPLGPSARVPVLLLTSRPSPATPNPGLIWSLSQSLSLTDGTSLPYALPLGRFLPMGYPEHSIQVFFLLLHLVFYQVQVQLRCLHLQEALLISRKD